ncbi:MAG: ImcF-related family protein [Bryobacteraceae bacterium]
MQWIWLIAGGGLTVWFAFTYGLELLLRLTGMQAWYFRISMWVLGILALATMLWYRWKTRKERQAEAAAGAGEPGSDDEIDVLVRDAEARLASAGQGAKLGSLPAVFVIGGAGSTKTSTVVHSGIEPELLSGQVYENHNITATRAANFWFARRAVLVEAGNKLISEPPRWLRLVRRLRPGKLASVFGKGGQAPRAALVCFDCETLARAASGDAAVVAARALRARLGEISETFGINLPVYVLFTKGDRLPFFADYVRNLTGDEATQVFGATVPMRPASAGVYAEEETQRLSARFEELFRSLAGLRPEYLARETEAARLPNIYEFPREFRKLRSAAVQFLVELCRPSQLTVGPLLRGFYFSGVRPVVVTEAPAPAPLEPAAPQPAGGATGMFRYGAQPAAVPAALPGAPRKVPQWVFLSHLFNDVLLGDKAAMGASGSSTKTSGLRRILLISGAALCLLLSVAFIISFAYNRGLESRAIDAARGIGAAESVGANLPSVDALRRLETLRQSLETLTAYNRDGAPLRYRWGLYAGDDMYPEVRRVYYNRFHQLLFGQTQTGLLETLRTLPATPGPEYEPTYNALKAYLITTSHHDKSTRLFLAPFLLARWSAGRGVDAERMDLARKQFEFYSEDLKLANPYSSENDGLAIEKARRYLAQFAGVERVYQFMLAECSKTNPPVNFNKKFPGSAETVIDNYDVAGPFTKGGWDFMKNAIRNSDKFFAGERWVLGDYASANIDRAKLEAELRQRYYADFLRQWRNYMKSAAVVRYASLADAAKKLTTLSGNQSTLLALFWLASQNTAVDDPAVAQAFQPIHTVMPPSSVDRYIAPPNQNYINALMTLQGGIDQIAQQPGPPNDAAAAQTLQQATAAKVATRQAAQAFRIDPEAHMEATVQKLMEDPITHVEALLRTIGPAELNGKGRALCGQWRALMSKYPFNPASTTQATLQEMNALVRKPDGALWTFYEGSLQKLLTRQGAQYAPAPTATVQINPAFVAFFNRAAAFAESAYPAGAQDPRIEYTLRPVPTEGMAGHSLRIDGQTISYSGGAAQPKGFAWSGAGTHEAVASVKFGGSDLGWANYEGLWAAYRFFGDAERWQAAGSGWDVEWIVRVGKNPVTLQGKPLTVRFHLEMANGAPPVFQRGYFSGLACVSEVAR